MGDQIIKQPNGKYMVFRSTCASIVLCEATPEDILEFWLEEEKASIERRLNRVIGQLEKGDRPYYQFTMTFEEALTQIEEIHGNDYPILSGLRAAQNV